MIYASIGHQNLHIKLQHYRFPSKQLWYRSLPHRQLHHLHLIIMAPKKMSTLDLAQRLEAIQATKEEIKVEEVMEMTLEELALENIQFGTRFMGKSFQVVYDTEMDYIKWYLRHQGQIKGKNIINHQKFLRYIQLRIEQEEDQWEEVVTAEGAYAASSGEPSSSGVQAVPSSSTAQAVPEELVAQQAATEHRLDQMEGVLQQVLQHLQALQLNR
jgi:hypothetical protein